MTDIDVVIEDLYALVMEFKVGSSAAEVLRQSKEKQYALPYLNQSKQVYIAGVGFRDGQIKEWMVEEMSR